MLPYPNYPPYKSACQCVITKQLGDKDRKPTKVLGPAKMAALWAGKNFSFWTIFFRQWAGKFQKENIKQKTFKHRKSAKLP